MRLLGFLAAIGLSLLGTTRANAEWREASTPHFVIYADIGERPLLRFARDLERFDAALRQIFGAPPPLPGQDNRPTIFMVPSQRGFEQMVGSRWIRGIFRGRASDSVAFMPEMAIDEGRFALDAQMVLQHEYTHFFMLQNLGGIYPSWYIEGAAELLSTARISDDGRVGIGLPALHRGYSLVEARRLPIEHVLDPTAEGASDSSRGDLFYARAWLLAHMLTFEPSRSGQLKRYLAAYAQGTPSLDAARQAFGDLAQLNSDLDRYQRRPKLSYLELNVDAAVTDVVATRPLGRGGDAILPVMLRSRFGVSQTTAASLVTRARQIGASFPNDPFVQTAVAEALYDADDCDGAVAAAGRALAADPKSTRSAIHIAQCRIDAARAHDDPAAWGEARRAIIAANRIDPDNARPLILYYTSYSEQGVTPPRQAVLGLNRALELAPQDDRLRFMVAQQTLKDGEYPRARALLTNLMVNPHARQLADKARHLISLIDAGKLTEASALADTAPMEDDAETAKLKADNLD